MSARRTPKAPRPSRSRAPFSISIKRISKVGDTESAENQTNQAVSGNHDKHSEESPEDFPLALVAFGIGGLGRYELEDTPKEHQESDAEGEQNQRVQYKLINLVEENGNIHLSSLIPKPY